MAEHNTQSVLVGTVIRITFHNTETGYTILKAAIKEERQPLAIVGVISDVHVGQEYEWTGKWITHPQYGRQFQVQTAKLIPPSTLEGIKRFLASGLIRGIGPSTAQKLIDAFGTDVFGVIEHTPEQLETVSGIGPAKAQRIVDSFREHQHVQQLLVFLQSHGVGQAIGLKIYRSYGERAIEVLQANPYRLALEVHGIGFRTADTIAKSLGILHDSPERLKAGIHYCLQMSLDEGHVCLPIEELLKKVRVELNVQQFNQDAILTFCNEIRDVVIERESGRFYVYLRPYFTMEEYVAKWFTKKLQMLDTAEAIQMSPNWLRESGMSISEHTHAADKRTLSDLGLDTTYMSHLAPEQLHAVHLSATYPVLIITGGPGTGKTTTVRAILEAAKQSGMQVVLAAPTGRAAKRLSETTTEQAKTIHRLLEYTHVEGVGLQFTRNQASPLQGDLFIIDEVSMLDIQMTYYLLRALPEHAKLILVGDTNQLPSVGAGQVLKDLIDSACVPKIELTAVFRQAQQSLIVRNAHRVLQGRMIEAGRKTDDCFYIREQEPDRVEQILKDLVIRRLPQYLAKRNQAEKDSNTSKPFDEASEWDDEALDFYDAIQVLVPMRKGKLGVDRVNEVLQEVLNPFIHGKSELQSQGVVFRVGDKVMQTKNNYTKDIYNGDIGKIREIDPEERQITVEYQDKGLVMYDNSELDEIQLAYALTIHKSQGSEYPIVVLPMLMEHAILLQRQMFYTALTRARQLVVILGQEKALQKAIQTTVQSHRFTRLRERMQLMKKL